MTPRQRLRQLGGGDGHRGESGNHRRRPPRGPRPDTVSEAIIGATFGTRILSQSTPGGDDLIGRLTLMWELLFPAIVTDSSLAYYREFLAREALRHIKHDPSS